MKIGLVLEGGAMRGMYTAGVLDVFMENDLTFDGGIGVSAGAVFGLNIKSKQIGRAIRYNKKYAGDKRYCSMHSLITTGDLYNVDFCYRTLPNELDIFDTETFAKNPMEFYVACTDVKTGKPAYYKCTDGGATDLLWLQASASLPFVSRDVKIGDNLYLDGGLSDSIPLKYMQSLGYEKNIVILTRHLGYRKEKNKALPLIKLRYRKYPELVNAVATRHIMYNDTLDYIAEQEKLGNTLVIRPSSPIDIGHTENDPNELERIYQLGRKDGAAILDKVRAFR